MTQTKLNSWISALVTVAISFVMVLALTLPVRAAEYDCGTYGAGDYDSSESCAAVTGEDDGLSNTGQALAVAIPAGLILAGVIILFALSRKSKHPKSE